MKIITFWCIIFACTFGLLKAEKIVTGGEADQLIKGAELIRFVDKSEAPAYIRLQLGQEIPQDNADRWLRKVLQMRVEDQLIFKSSSKDKLGFEHIRFSQTYRGVPVEGGSYILHLRNGQIHSVNGEFYPNLDFQTVGLMSEASGLQRALDFVNANSYHWQNEKEELRLQYESGNPFASYYPTGELVVCPKEGDANRHEFSMAWKYDIYASDPLSRSFVFVNASSGEIIWNHERLHTADVVGTAMTAYSGSQAMTGDSFSGGFRLRESGRGNGIETYDMNTGTSYGNAVDFSDTDNIWNNVNGNLDEYATDAHWGAEMTYDYFNLLHNRNSIDGNGFRLYSYVHYDNSYGNAFWDGQRMTYGDGSGQFTPLTALDVAGHEITHGLTTFTAGLVYQNESGALNESFSDIFGNSIENYARPSQWSWIIGEDMTSSGNGIRDMANPNVFGDPDTYQGTNYYNGTADNGGVHTNSGVQNKWYYIMVTGETGTNDLGNAYNVTGQGFTKASSIAFRNLTVYLSSGSDYADARFFAIQSATDLYGPCGAEVIATTNAWYAVGVGNAFSFSISANFSASPTGYCSAPAAVNFSNQSVNGGSYLWDFGDGNTSTDVNPTHTYLTLGNFTVTLSAFGGPCGNDTLVQTQYIQVDTNLACTVTMNPSGPNTTQTTCSGTVYDTGGPSNNYGPNTNSEITISPVGAATVTLTFASFDFENNFDYLYIYDGATTASPLIGVYTGTGLPNGGTITSSNSSITLVQSTDPGVEEAGFEVSWLCQLPNTPPNTDFSADNLNSCNGIVNFTDLTTNGATSWAWDFGDGFNSTMQHPSHTYVNNGTYTISLIATNQIGADTLVRTAYIVVSKPVGPTANGASRCGPGTVTLTATGTGNMVWWDASSSGNQVGTGNSFTTPVLTNSVVYYVEEESPSPSLNVGPANPVSVGGGGYHGNNSTQYLEFNVSTDMTLVSAYVDPDGGGNRTIQLWDDQGNFIRDTTMFISAPAQRITLNWSIQPGSYRIGGTQMDLYRNNSGPAYPYNLNGLVSITGSSAGNDFYYYLYDWEVKGKPCLSQRTAVPATINQLPAISLSPSGTVVICPGGSVNLTASGGNSYQWSTGANSSSISVNQAGTYYAVGMNGIGCSDTSAIVTVTVATPSAVITANGPTTFCPGDSVSLMANSGSAYVWSTGSTASSITVTNSGTYMLTVTDNNGCPAVTSQAISVTNTPSVSISTSNGSTNVCIGGSMDLTATLGNSYVWSTGATSQSININSAGTYTVTVTFPGGCTGAEPITINAVNPPVAAISNSNGTEFCLGDATDLTASGGGSYLWSTGASSPMITVNSAGTYMVTVTDGNGCTDVGTEVITVNSLPNAGIVVTGGAVFCDGDSSELTGTGGSSYAWSTGASSNSIFVSTAGSYDVTVTDSNGCSSAASQNITVNANPVADFAYNANFLQLTFSDQSSGGASYSWDFGDGNFTNQQNPQHTYLAAGTYTVVLVVYNAQGCADTSSQVITVLAVGLADLDGVSAFQISGIYPNPFQETVSFDLEFPEAGRLRMEVMDVLGHRSIGLFDEEVNAGEFRWNWKAGERLAEGTYIVKMEFNGQARYRKLVHIR